MKKLQKLAASVLALCLSIGALAFSAAAADGETTPQITHFADGSYIITTIEYDRPQGEAAAASAQSVKSGTKINEYYNSSDELAWEFCVHGTFTYDGSTAEATDADYFYEIYDSSWSFVKASASCSGATATATGSFKLLLVPHSVTVTLTCSPKGVLS